MDRIVWTSTIRHFILALLLPLGLSSIGARAQLIDQLQFDERRELVVEALIRSDGTAGLIRALVSNTPPTGYAGTQGHLEIFALDESGSIVAQRFAWDPRLERARDDDGNESEVEVDEAAGLFSVLFDHQITSLRIAEADGGALLLEVDMSPVVEDFCVSHPDDSNCLGYVPPAPDTDGDTVVDDSDLCPNTQVDAEVDVNGCSAAQRDTDGDSVADNIDECPATPQGTEVDAAGCPLPQAGDVCDVDVDGDVDRIDILRVFWSMGTRDIAPGDPRDADVDGRIGLRDLFICLGSCDRKYCATQ